MNSCSGATITALALKLFETSPYYGACLWLGSSALLPIFCTGRAAELPEPARIFDVIKSLPSKDATIGVKQGPQLAGARIVEATYTKPYMSHGSIGPSAAVAEFKDGQMTVWTHSQGVFPLRGELVKALKMPASAVR